MRDPSQGPVKVAVCAAPGDVGDAIQRALERSAAFEFIGRAANAEALAGLVHTHLPDAVVIDEMLGEGDVGAMLARVTAGRPIQALVLVDDEVAERHQSRKPSPNLGYLARPTILDAGLVARSHVSRRLTELEQDCAGEERTTIPADLLVETVERRQSLAGRAGIREELTTLGTWPLDLIVLVGGRGNEQLLPGIISRLTTTSVPVLVLLRPYAALPDGTWASSRVPVTPLEADVRLRDANGILVAPRTGAVHFSADKIHVVPGAEPLLVVDTVRSTAALQSGALTIQLGDSETDTALALAGVLDAGAAAAVLDPEATTHPAGPRAALSWGRALVTLTGSELLWLLGNAAPRRT